MLGPKKAHERGFEFTGNYVNKYEDESRRVAQNAYQKELKNKGYKAIKVQEDGGVAIYAEARYFIDRHICDLEKRVAGYQARCEIAKKNYEAALAEIDAEQTSILKELNRLKDEVSK